MKETTKRALVILLILAISIGIGFATDAVWSLIERNTHPQTYADIIEKYADAYNIPKEIVFSVIKAESGFDPSARSEDDALGLMQMIPSTFEWLTGEEHLGEHLSVQSLYEPDVSIRYGAYYLRYLYQKFNCNWETALAAYNGGEGNVAQWLADPEYSDADGNLTYIPFKETRGYVQKVTNAREMYQKLYYEEKEGIS